MSSTEFNVGLTGAKNSSRVLKPPGGGHSDIFGAAQAQAPGPRAKYDQQNSSNLNFCMNTTDPNVLVEQQKAAAASAAAQQQQQQQSSDKQAQNGGDSNHTGADSIGSVSQKQQGGEAKQQGRVPPGGFSSGLW